MNGILVTLRRFVTCVAFFAALVWLWHSLVRRGTWSAILLPDPSAVWIYLVGAVKDGTLLQAAAVTMRRLLIGYGIGIALGIPLGLLTARFRIFSDTIGVLALGLQTLPSVCWVPLTLLWFGQTESAMLFVVVMGSLWSMVIATDNGVRNVPPIFSRAARTMGAKPIYTLIFVMLPASLPFIVSGMKQGWAFAWRSLMAAELIAVSPHLGPGVGQVMAEASDNNDMAMAFGTLIIILIIGIGINAVFFAPLERHLLRSRGLARS